MKTTVREGTFEANSSSTHSLTIMMKDEYDKWDANNYIYNGSGFYWAVDNKPKSNKVYSKEEVINFMFADKYNDKPKSYYEELSDDEFREYAREDNFISGDWWDYTEYETYKKTFTTPGGETVVAFGYYGNDY